MQPDARNPAAGLAAEVTNATAQDQEPIAHPQAVGLLASVAAPGAGGQGNRRWAADSEREGLGFLPMFNGEPMHQSQPQQQHQFQHQLQQWLPHQLAPPLDARVAAHQLQPQFPYGAAVSNQVQHHAQRWAPAPARGRPNFILEQDLGAWNAGSRTHPAAIDALIGRSTKQRNKHATDDVLMAGACPSWRACQVASTTIGAELCTVGYTTAAEYAAFVQQTEQRLRQRGQPPRVPQHGERSSQPPDHHGRVLRNHIRQQQGHHPVIYAHAPQAPHRVHHTADHSGDTAAPLHAAGASPRPGPAAIRGPAAAADIHAAAAAAAAAARAPAAPSQHAAAAAHVAAPATAAAAAAATPPARCSTREAANQQPSLARRSPARQGDAVPRVVLYRPLQARCYRHLQVPARLRDVRRTARHH